MEELLQQVENYKKEITVYEANTAEGAEAFRIKYLGTKGLVKTLMAEMKNIPAEQKKNFGQVMNEFKQFAEAKYETLKQATAQTKPQFEKFDYTLPGDPFPVGTRHPITLVRNKIVDIFHRLGFAVAEGPEIEDDWHNFTSMNLPLDHP